MVKKYGTVPFAPLIVIDIDTEISEELLLESLAGRKSASIVLRWTVGPPGRGGYFFHISLAPERVGLHDFEGRIIVTWPMKDAIRLINHASGRAFDAEMLDLCQKEINLRQDKDEALAI